MMVSKPHKPHIVHVCLEESFVRCPHCGFYLSHIAIKTTTNELLLDVLYFHFTDVPCYVITRLRET
jgi:hypothetical protein